jgi:hypothetical protein
MTQWLLAAEADKIQDFIFRSSRLIQVVGGSGLLTRFCAEAPELLLARQEKSHSEVTPHIIVSDGGKFLISFDDGNGTDETGRTVAKTVGRELAEAYYRATDSTLTVAEPQPYEEGGYSIAHDRAEADLRAQKATRQAARATAQIPYTAICASCGISLAHTRAKRIERDDEEEMALCQACRHKAAERALLRQHPARERFLGRFREALQNAKRWRDLPPPVREDLGVAGPRSFADLLPSDAEEVGVYDPRNYVAYIVADGNSMGVLFSKCKTPEQVQALSKALSDTMWTALAETTIQVVQRLWRAESGDRAPSEIPVTPLIVGGDDLFALVPARYSIAAAQQLCLEFEEAMQEVVEMMKGLGEEGQFDVPAPTMSAAVVICKQNYPYALAHRRGEELLKETKELVRDLQLRRRVRLSAVDFTVVHGGDVSAAGLEKRKYLQPSLRPYWISSAPLPAAVEPYGRSLSDLLAARYELRSLPGKRRAELRHLFHVLLPEEVDTRSHTPLETVLMELRTSWRPRFEALYRRIDVSGMERVLAWLGSDDTDDQDFPWLWLEARPHKPLAHGIPDLLESWHFAQSLAHDLVEYEE